MPDRRETERATDLPGHTRGRAGAVVVLIESRDLMGLLKCRQARGLDAEVHSILMSLRIDGEGGPRVQYWYLWIRRRSTNQRVGGR